MRGTFNLDEIIDKQVRDLAKKERVSIKDILNKLLSIGLKNYPHKGKKVNFTINAKNCGFQPGIAQDHLNRLIDEVDDKERFTK